MKTLHGLVTIYELFVGFNLINTSVVNCVTICQNARKMHHSEAKKSKIFWGGSTHSPNPPSRRLDTRAFGVRPAPQIHAALKRQMLVSHPNMFFSSLLMMTV